MIAASVWMNVWNWRPGTMSRPLADTIPAVTVSDSPNGLPTARDPVAHLHAVGIAHLCGGQSAVHLHLDHSQISFLIGADNLGVVLHAWRIVFKANPNSVCLLDDVPVRQDVSFGIDDHTGP